MTEDQLFDQSTSGLGQLTQARVHLEDAAEALSTRDGSPSIPTIFRWSSAG